MRMQVEPAEIGVYAHSIGIPAKARCSTLGLLLRRWYLERSRVGFRVQCEEWSGAGCPAIGSGVSGPQSHGLQKHDNMEGSI